MAPLLGLVWLGGGCEGKPERAVDAEKELRTLERALAELADADLHPVLALTDLEPLQRMSTRHPRVNDARLVCLRQYETIARTQDDLARCSDLEEQLRASVHEMSADAGDPARLLAQAQDVCGRAFRGADRIEESRRACDERIAKAREALGLPR